MLCPITMEKFSQSLLRGGYALLGLLAGLYCAWQLMIQVNFAYPLWYDVAGIADTIGVYGPRNRFRDEFATTDKAEHLRLFAAIVTALRRGGAGLAEIRYRTPDGRAIDTLLRAPEIVHLRDVAALIAHGQQFGAAALLLWLLGVVIALWRCWPPPPLWQQFKCLAMLLLTAGAVLLVVGPVRVFYRLHVWIFPPEHPWFFYYEDSLMTTLMQAPNLFGYIGAAWVMLGVAGFVLLSCFFNVLYCCWQQRSSCRRSR